MDTPGGVRVQRGRLTPAPRAKGLCPSGKRLCPQRGNDSLHFMRRYRSYKMCSLCIAGAQGASAPMALRVVDCPWTRLRRQDSEDCGLRLSAAMIIKSALRDLSAGIGHYRGHPLSGFAGLTQREACHWSDSSSLTTPIQGAEYGLSTLSLLLLKLHIA